MYSNKEDKDSVGRMRPAGLGLDSPDLAGSGGWVRCSNWRLPTLTACHYMYVWLSDVKHA